MRGAQLAELLADGPPAITEALDLVTDVDDVLVHGFARLGEQHTAALSALGGAVAATPLGVRVGEAVGKIIAGSVAEEHLTALAAARAALLGAVHDAMLSHVDAALGRTRAAWAAPAPEPGPADNLTAGSRSWLTELALAGWRGVDHDLVSSSGQTLQALLSDPARRRTAVLVDGLAAELRASCPVATMDRLPARRWADLWSRGLLLAQAGGVGGGASGSASSGDPATAGRVSGRLHVLGVDVHEHATAVQVQVHGLLEPAGGDLPRLVRTSVSALKVDTIVGPALWQLLRAHPVLLGALAGHRSLDLTELVLLDSGDLVWADDRASLGEPSDPFVVARVQLAEAVAPAVPPLDRHPVRIAEPVLVEGYTASVADGGATVTFTVDGSVVTVAVDRLPSCGPLTTALVAASTACIGLIRWDGGRWMLQPLAVQATVKRKAVGVHTGDWALGPTDPKVVKSGAKVGDAVAVLRERAGRLLRR